MPFSSPSLLLLVLLLLYLLFLLRVRDYVFDCCINPLLYSIWKVPGHQNIITTRQIIWTLQGLWYFFFFMKQGFMQTGRGFNSFSPALRQGNISSHCLLLWLIPVLIPQSAESLPVAAELIHLHPDRYSYSSCSSGSSKFNVYGRKAICGVTVMIHDTVKSPGYSYSV